MRAKASVTFWLTYDNLAGMRRIESPQALNSRFMYAFADSVYDAVEGTTEIRSGLDDDQLFQDLALDVRIIARPHRITALHSFIAAVCKCLMEYVAYDAVESATDYFEDLLMGAKMPIPRWLTPKRAPEHRAELYALACKAIDVAIPSVFFILFSDREFLRKFQIRLSEHIATLESDDHPDLFKRNGMLRRCALPQWLKQGIFYRDRGRCQSCFCDLSGLMRPVADLQLDHIVPLASSGSNDPTNFQLLCGRCNNAKGQRRVEHRPWFTPYWPVR